MQNEIKQSFRIDSIVSSLRAVSRSKRGNPMSWLLHHKIASLCYRKRGSQWRFVVIFSLDHCSVAGTEPRLYFTEYHESIRFSRCRRKDGMTDWFYTGSLPLQGWRSFWGLPRSLRETTRDNGLWWDFLRLCSIKQEIYKPRSFGFAQDDMFFLYLIAR